MQSSSVRATAVQISPGADRETVILEHMPQIKRVAHRICAKLPSYIDADDLISDGVLGLLDSVDKFDPSRGVSFKTYAEYRIRGAILDNLRNQDWVSRSMRTKSRQFASTQQTMEMLNGRKPTNEEMADAMHISIEKLHELIKDIGAMKMDSLSDPVLSEGETGNQAPLIEGRTNPADQFTNLLKSEVRDLLAAAIDELSDREKTIILLYYYEDRTMVEIGETLAINGSRVSQIHSQAMFKLRTKLIALGRRQ
jgi:RNA polymerase sigma factor for flagellar operon FliA